MIALVRSCPALTPLRGPHGSTLPGLQAPPLAPGMSEVAATPATPAASLPHLLILSPASPSPKTDSHTSAGPSSLRGLRATSKLRGVVSPLVPVLMWESVPVTRTGGTLCAGPKKATSTTSRGSHRLAPGANGSTLRIVSGGCDGQIIRPFGKDTSMANTSHPLDDAVMDMHTTERLAVRLVSRDGVIDDEERCLLEALREEHRVVSDYRKRQVAAESFERNGDTKHTRRFFADAGTGLIDLADERKARRANVIKLVPRDQGPDAA